MEGAMTDLFENKRTSDDIARDKTTVEEAAAREYMELVDQRLEQKLQALDVITKLIALEEASWSVEARTGRWQ
jgi:hypothetical protein